MLATLLECRTSALREVAGACNGSAEFLEKVNTATRRLMRRGDWAGTTIPIHVCSRAGCVVYPRYVKFVRKVSMCRTPIIIKNGWWEQAWYDTSNPRGWWNRSCMGRPFGQMTATEGLSETPVFQDIQGDNRTVRVYPLAQADIGREVTIFGIDNNNQVLRTKQSDGTWRDGVIITVANPFGSTNVFVRRIDRVLIEDGVQSTLRMYAYNADTDLLEDLAFYEPGETNPAYVKQQLRIPNCCDGTMPLLALVKLRFVPARFDTDLILLENLDALKLMMQAINYENAGDRQQARLYEADAIREASMDLWDRDQEDQIPVDLGELAGTGIGRQIMW